MRHLLALLLLVSPAVAADTECPNSVSIEEVTRDIAASEGDILYLLDLPGDGFDQMLILEVGGMIQHMGFFKGCAISGGFALGPVRVEAPKV